MKKTLITLLISAGSIAGLSACSTPATIFTSETVERSSSPYYHEYTKQQLGFKPLVQQIEEDLLKDYNIVAIDVPTVQDFNVNEAMKETNPYEALVSKRQNTKQWVDGYYATRLDPAVVRVLTDDNERHFFEVALVNDKPVLFSLPSHHEKASEVMPYELLKDKTNNKQS